MAVGWSRDGAVQEQIDATVESGVQLAKSRLPDGESLTHCEECEVAIPDVSSQFILPIRSRSKFLVNEAGLGRI